MGYEPSEGLTRAYRGARRLPTGRGDFQRGSLSRGEESRGGVGKISIYDVCQIKLVPRTKRSKHVLVLPSSAGSNLDSRAEFAGNSESN